MKDFSLDKLVCEPFADNSVKMEAVGEGTFKAMRISNTKTSLTELKLIKEAVVNVGGNLITLDAGTGVFVRSSDYAQPWAKDVLSLGEEKFIVVPPSRVEFYR